MEWIKDFINEGYAFLLSLGINGAVIFGWLISLLNKKVNNDKIIRKAVEKTVAEVVPIVEEKIGTGLNNIEEKTMTLLDKEANIRKEDIEKGEEKARLLISKLPGGTVKETAENIIEKLIA